MGCSAGQAAERCRCAPPDRSAACLAAADSVIGRIPGDARAGQLLGRSEGINYAYERHDAGQTEGRWTDRRDSRRRDRAGDRRGSGALAAGGDGAIRADRTAKRPDAAYARGVRARTKLTQAEFAARIGVPIETVRNWEQGKRSPRGPARALLKVIEKAPRARICGLAARRAADRGIRPERACALPPSDPAKADRHCCDCRPGGALHGGAKAASHGRVA